MTAALLLGLLALGPTIAWAVWVHGDVDAPSFTKFVQTVFDRGKARTLAGVLRTSSQRPAIRLWAGLVDQAERLARDGVKDSKIVREDLGATQQAWERTLRPVWVEPALLLLLIAAPLGRAAMLGDTSLAALALPAAAVIPWLYGVALARRRRFELGEEVQQIIDLVAAQVHRGWVTAPAAPLPPPPPVAPSAPIAPIAPPREAAAAPKACASCGKTELARGDFIVLRAVDGATKIEDLPQHGCEAVICLDCGRLDWFLKDPAALLDDDRPRPRPVRRVDAKA